MTGGAGTERISSEVLALRQELDESNQGLLALHADLSDQQDELERARAAAEEAAQDKADFLANMSHEIRSPMTAVIGFTSLLQATELTPEQADYTEAIEAAGTHLLGIIEGILDLSKIESGLLELEDIPFDLFACVEDAVDLVAGRASDKNLTLGALFAPGVPPWIVGDPLRLRQVLVNLLANAVKFTAHGHVVVDVAQDREGGDSRRLGFHVRDTGSGIPAERVERLFTPYAQADASTARSHGGTGLGLTICRQLAELMGGAITVESAVGEGSTFTCTIRARAAEHAPASRDSDPALCGSQVLVVSEQTLVAEAIGRHLTGWGAELVTAASIDTAISRSGEWPRAALAIIDAGRRAGVAADIVRLAAASANPLLPVICVAATAVSRPAPAGPGPTRPAVRTPIRRDHLRKAVLAALSESSEPSPTARAGDSPPTGADPGRAVPAPAREAPAPARHVLYVDDNPMLTALVDRIFAADPSVTVQTAPDGKTAMNLARQQQPDVVMLDLHLPDMSGEALLQQLRADARTRWIPAVIVSGDIALATSERLRNLGVAACLAKPFTPSQLSALVSAISYPAGGGQ